MKPTIFDIAGIGIGPFNLGLAALLCDLPSLQSIFFDQKDSFGWHKGMMINNTTLQVPFYADLVTLADPCNRFNFMSFLQHTKRIYRFAFKENNFITRKEYNQYCTWVAGQLSNLHFGSSVKMILFNNRLDCYEILVATKDGAEMHFFSHHLVIGIGSQPRLPPIDFPAEACIFHSSNYLFRKAELSGKKNIAIIGSGQSAAEIFYDLLPYHSELKHELSWFTKSPRIFPMDYSSFALEMASPEYIDYFFGLSEIQKREVLSKQDSLYKGINQSLIQQIYEYLYNLFLETPACKIGIFPNAELIQVENTYEGIMNLKFRHLEKEKIILRKADAVVLATGYYQPIPHFILPVRERINWNVNGLYEVHRNYSIDIHEKEVFVQNAELHTHGFNAPDLSLGPYRNACILNAILGYKHFATHTGIGFQRFELEENEDEKGLKKNF